MKVNKPKIILKFPLIANNYEELENIVKRIRKSDYIWNNASNFEDIRTNFLPHQFPIMFDKYNDEEKIFKIIIGRINWDNFLK